MNFLEYKILDDRSIQITNIWDPIRGAGEICLQNYIKVVSLFCPQIYIDYGETKLFLLGMDYKDDDNHLILPKDPYRILEVLETLSQIPILKLQTKYGVLEYAEIPDDRIPGNSLSIKLPYDLLLKAEDLQEQMTFHTISHPEASRFGIKGLRQKDLDTFLKGLDRDSVADLFYQESKVEL